MSAADWSTWLSSTDNDLPTNGHFATARIRNGTVYLATDAVGLRTMYVAKSADGIVFSTRLYWVSRLSGITGVDLEALGSHWTAHQQLSLRSLVTGISRLGQGARCSISLHDFIVSEEPWLPDISTETVRPQTLLSDTLTMNLPSERQISFGLSGGMDSRTLLAFIAGTPDANLHVFGPADHPDVRIAKRLAGITGHSINNISEEFPPADESWEIARRHALEANAIAPASAALSMRYFDLLDAENRFVMDGGFGEIARRQFMNRLLRSSTTPITERTPEQIIGTISVNRANVFNRDIQDALRRGVRRDVEEIFWSRPDIDNWTDADQVDLIAIRSRLPNFFGFEQARMDGLIPNLMPFADNDFLSCVFSIPMQERQHATLYRRIIRDAHPSFSRVPLVKGLTTYPFGLGPVAAFAWTTIKGRLGMHHQDLRRDNFLQGCEAQVHDLLNSPELRDSGLYDLPTLHNLVSGYYRGERGNGVAIDWWLAFEFWRQGVSGTSR